MRQIAFYGKGGIGKSTIACHFSYSAAEKGLRVLQVGCSPKNDSFLRSPQRRRRHRRAHRRHRPAAAPACPAYRSASHLAGVDAWTDRSSYACRADRPPGSRACLAARRPVC